MSNSQVTVVECSVHGAGDKVLHFIGEWLSLAERLVWDQDVAGSNPVSPTIGGIEMRRDIVKIFLALIAIAAAVVAIVGVYICGINIIQAVFGVGGNYTTALNWFITSLSCTFGARIIYSIIKGDK